jgi:hypothetical protein
MSTNAPASHRSRILRGSLPAVVVCMFFVFSAPASAASTLTVTSVTNPLLQGFSGVRVTITGTGFTHGAKVKVSGVGVTLASPNVVSATTITAKATVTPTAPTGTRNVTVTTTSGSATCKGCVTIKLQGGSLQLSPTSQTVASGSDVTVDVIVSTATYSVNTVQSVFKYSPTNFSLVSAEPGPAFGEFPVRESRGSIKFAAGSTTPVSGTQVAAVITLKATGTGSSSVTLPRLCPPDDFAISCSAAYDATTNENDLSQVFGRATYTVT